MRCWVCGRRRAALSDSVASVDWSRLCGDPDKLGVFPGRRSPEQATSSFAAGSIRGPQSRSTARKLFRVSVPWIIVFFSSVVFGDDGFRSRVVGALRRGSQGLVCYFLISGDPLCKASRFPGVSRVFWSVQRVVSCNLV
jgi:hypothetical protein